MKFGDLTRMARKIELNWQVPLAHQHEIPVRVKLGDRYLECTGISLVFPCEECPDGVITVNVEEDAGS